MTSLDGFNPFIDIRTGINRQDAADAVIPPRQPDTDTNPVGDAVLGVFRGAAGAVENVLDLVPNMLGYDLLPENLGLGQSDTTAGMFIEGTTNFLTGFIPIFGWLGRTGAFAKSARVAAGGVKFAKKAEAAKLGAGVLKSKQAVPGVLKRLTTKAPDAGKDLARNLAASGLTDFLVFDGNDPRISNMLQNMGIQTAVTDYLAASDEDSEIEGRLKNVVEGMGAGFVMDAIFGVLKANKRLISAVQDGAEEAAVNKALSELETATTDLLRAPTSKEMLEDEILKARWEDTTIGAGRQAREKLEGAPSADPNAKTLKAPKSRKAARAQTVDALSEKVAKVVEGMMDVDQAKAFSKAYAEAKVDGEDVLGKVAGVLNFSTISESGTRLMMRMIADQENLEALAKASGESLSESGQLAAASLGKISGMKEETVLIKAGRDAGMSTAEIIAAMAGKDADALKNIRHRTFAYLKFTETYIDHFRKLSEAVAKDAGYAMDGVNLTADQAAVQWTQSYRTAADLLSSFGRLRGESGRLLGNFRMTAADIPELDLGGILDSKGGRKRVVEQARKFNEDHWTMGSAVGKTMVARSTKDHIWAMTSELYYGSLLSGVRTLTTNYIGSAMWTGYRSLERQVGSAVGKYLRKDMADELVRVGARERGAMVDMFGQMVDTVKWALRGKATESVKNANLAAREGRDVLRGGRDAGSFDKQLGDAFSPENVRSTTDLVTNGRTNGAGGWTESMLTFLGKAANLPGRVMQWGDAHVKYMRYTSKIKSELKLQAVDYGFTGKEADRWIESQMDSMLREGAAATRENLTREAVKNFPNERFSTKAEARRFREDWIDRKLADVQIPDVPPDFVGPRAPGYLDPQQAMEGIGPTAPATHEALANPLYMAPVKNREGLARSALKDSVSGTFQDVLSSDRGGALNNALIDAGHHVQNFMRAHPSMAFFTPFVRTPINILESALERSPFPGVNQDFTGLFKWAKSGSKLGPDLAENSNVWIRQASSKDPEVVADAIGRLSMSLGIMATISTAVGAGMITGGGPHDLELKRVWEQAGHQPYSIKVGNAYVSYERMEPFATVLGFYADIADTLHFSDSGDWTDPETNGDITAISAAALMALTRSLSSKSYLMGMMQGIDLLQDPEGSMEQYVAQVAGSFMVPNVVTQMREVTDPYHPQLRGVLERIGNRIPGYGSKYIDKRRNVLGEPMTKKSYDGVMQQVGGWLNWVLPVEINRTSSDTLSKEFSELMYPFRAPQAQQYGLDLRDVYNAEKTQSAYDRWQQVTSEIKIDGRGIRSALERLVNSNDYRALPKPRVVNDKDAPQVIMIGRVVDAYRQAAKQQIMREFPELLDAAQNQIVDRRSRWNPQESYPSLFPLDR